ncbi:recombination-associated protein RdgC [Pseudacidovorax intermedius]|uniref:recombination-associated protein RdgC n=1 Tax=Pseudacidovorax intermedius TaxID=433924 RepID=UPI0026F18B88|nr:recombination-associated protein RdgC [Pseudacidovorax intermedius]
MRFKHCICYRVAPGWYANLALAEAQLQAQRFVPCSPTQESSAGWVEPRGQQEGPLLESVAGQWLLEYLVESKTVPASVVRRKLDERCAQIERQAGRKPGKKERQQLKEDITHELLPMAFSRFARVAVWIDSTGLRLSLNTSSQARADEVVTALVKALDGFGVTAFHTQTEPSGAMAAWLADGGEDLYEAHGFTIDRECELKATDDSKAVVRYGRHPLDIEEVRQHIAQGKRPTRLALTWEDRVSFELTEGLQLRKLRFLGGVFDGTDLTQADAFDTDAAIVTAELGKLLPALLEALGGEVRA